MFSLRQLFSSPLQLLHASIIAQLPATMARRSRRTSAIEGSLTAIGVICFLPFICVAGGKIIASDLFDRAKSYVRFKKWERRQPEERKIQMMRSTPRTVSPRLERHLTIGRPKPKPSTEELNLREKSEEIGVVKISKALTVTDRQEKSGLFKLPFEIRCSIYEELLGGHVIHIYFVEAYRRMSHTRCKHLSPEICRRIPCGQRFKVPGAPDEWGNVGLLSILQSCRRM